MVATFPSQEPVTPVGSPANVAPVAPVVAKVILVIAVLIQTVWLVPVAIVFKGVIVIHSWTVLPHDGSKVCWAIIKISSIQRGGSLEPEASFLHLILNNKLAWLSQAGNVVIWLNQVVWAVKFAPAWIQVVPPLVLYSKEPKSSISVPLLI